MIVPEQRHLLAKRNRLAEHQSDPPGFQGLDPGIVGVITVRIELRAVHPCLPDGYVDVQSVSIDRRAGRRGIREELCDGLIHRHSHHGLDVGPGRSEHGSAQELRCLVESPWTLVGFESGGRSRNGGENLVGKLAYSFALRPDGENSDVTEISFCSFLEECASSYIHSV